MEYPVPPDYLTVQIARWCLVGMGAAGIAVLWWRLARLNFIRPIEMVYWYAAAIFEFCFSRFGNCEFTVFDNNWWQFVALMVALASPIAGLTITFLRCDSIVEFFRVIALCMLMTVFVGAYLLRPAIVEMSVWPKPRHSSSRIECFSNARQLGMAITNAANRQIPPSITGDPEVSWRISILSMLDRSSLFREYDPSVAWDKPPNSGVASQFIPQYQCPSNYLPFDSQGRRYTAFSMPTGPQTVGNNPRGTYFDEITDGASNTLLIVEASGAQIVWSEPRDVDVVMQPTGINLKGKKPGQSDGWLSSYHRYGVNVVMADGSGRFLSAETDPALLRKLATIDAGDN